MHECLDGEGTLHEGLEDNNEVTHRRRFNDKYQDEISGLGYYGFRYHDTIAIAWTQSDPLYRFAPDIPTASLGSPRRANLYTFNLNNALRYLDPDGRDPKKSIKKDPYKVTYQSTVTNPSQRREQLISTVEKSIESTFKSGTAAKMLALGGRSASVSPKAQTTARGGKPEIGNVHIMITDRTDDEASVKATRDGGGSTAMRTISQDKDAAGASSRGMPIVLDIERIEAATAGATSAATEELLDTIIAHEFGHHPGLKHKGDGRSSRDLMHEEKSLKTRNRKRVNDDDKKKIKETLK